MKLEAPRIFAALLTSGVLCTVALAQAPFSQPAPAPAAKPSPPTPGAKPPLRRPLAGGGLYIAGDGFSLEQAVDDGLRESGGRSAFAVLVLNTEISKLGIHGASSEVASVIRRANQNRGTLYVCERDVKRQVFAAHEFLPGVEVVRGFSAQEAAGLQAEKAGGPPLAPLPRMRAICAT